MSGNARGQLKEEMEGIIRNIGWIQKHSEQALEILADKNTQLSDMFKGLHSVMGEFAEQLTGVYATM
jgi:hypothetical protein